MAQNNPNTEKVATEIPMNVEGGKQYRADLVVQEKNGELIIIEGKASGTAPYTPNQKIDFANNNGSLIGDSTFTKKGTTIFGKDVVIKEATKVNTIRPDNINELLKLLNS